MNTIALHSLNNSPVGRTIVNALSKLEEGKYALVPEKNGRTRVLRLTKSEGTDFYKYFDTIKLPFHRIQESNLFPCYAVELNASPAGSDSQEYALDALVFYV